MRACVALGAAAVSAAMGVVSADGNSCLAEVFIACGDECLGDDQEATSMDFECVRTCVSEDEELGTECVEEVLELLDGLEACQGAIQEACPEVCVDDDTDCKKALRECLQSNETVEETCEGLPQLDRKKGKGGKHGNGKDHGGNGGNGGGKENGGGKGHGNGHGHGGKRDRNGTDMCFVLARYECGDLCRIENSTGTNSFGRRFKLASGFDLDCIGDCVEGNENLPENCTGEIQDTIERVELCDLELETNCPSTCSELETSEERKACRSELHACINSTESVADACGDLLDARASELADPNEDSAPSSSTDGNSSSALLTVGALAAVAIVVAGAALLRRGSPSRSASGSTTSVIPSTKGETRESTVQRTYAVAAEL